MTETEWHKIKQLETVVENGDPEPAIAFLRILAANDLLTRHTFAALCETAGSGTGQDVHSAWHLLHQFARGYAIDD